MKCPYCGEEIADNVNMCPVCQENLQKQSGRKCPYCNEPISDGANICPVCGETILQKVNVSELIAKNKVLLIIFGVIFFILLLLAGVGTFIYHKVADYNQIKEYEVAKLNEFNEREFIEKLVINVSSEKRKMSFFQKDIADEAIDKLSIILQPYNAEVVKSGKDEITIGFNDYYEISDYESIVEKANSPLLVFKEEISSKDSKYEETELTSKYLKKVDYKDNKLSLVFDKEGSKILEDLSTKLVGKSVGVFWGDKLIISPKFTETIKGGNVEVSGATGSPIFDNDAIDVVSSLKADIDGIKFSTTIEAPKLSANGYRTITTDIKSDLNLYDILATVSNQEKDLMFFFKKNEKKEDNIKLFEIFVDNLFTYRDMFLSKYNSGSGNLGTFGIRTDKDIYDTGMDSVKILDPKVDSLEFSYIGAFGVGLNYEYMLKTYSPYLNAEWKDYFSISLEESRALRKAEYMDDGSIVEVYNNSAQKWAAFLKKHPNFYLKTKVSGWMNECRETYDRMKEYMIEDEPEESSDTYND